jgi:hypothetical protein
MPLLGELGVVEAGVRCFEIGAAVLLVGIEEEGIEPPVEIIMARDIVLRTVGRIELLGMPHQIAQPPLQLGPARQYLGLVQQNRQRIRDRALLDDESALHVDFAQCQFRVEQDPPFGLGSQEADGHRVAGAITACESGSARGRERHRPAANELGQEVTQQTVHRNHQAAIPLEASASPAAPLDAHGRGMVPPSAYKNIIFDFPVRYCVVHKADIPKCHVRALASDARFHSRDNRLKGDRRLR